MRTTGNHLNNSVNRQFKSPVVLFFLLSQTASAFLFSRSQGLERASYLRLINGLNSKNSREFFLPELNADSAEQFNTRLYYANRFEPSDDMYQTKL